MPSSTFSMPVFLAAPAPEESGTIVSAMARSAPVLRVLAEERGLGDGRLLQLVEQHALVGGVDVRVAVRGAHEQYLGLRRGRLQRTDERDRSAARGVDRRR